MKTMNMISRRSFLKAATAAAVVSALGLTGWLLRLFCRSIQHRFQRCRFRCRRF
mgnify:CR=1 FL=1|jgi:hypothetical protein